jgi:hypothetical protein
MSFLKIITAINWVLISIYAAFIIWGFLQQANPNNNAGGGEQEVALKAVGVFLLLVLIGLNLLSYSWTKILAFILVILFLLLIRYIATH